MRTAKAQRVAVALSGGVDSSVAAARLLAEGYEVVGVTLKLQNCADTGASRSCCGVDGMARARAAAGRLGIPHYVVDCTGEFEARVLRPAWEEYAAGRTPSPCLLCNERIKFGLLLAWARQIGAGFLATGHYARREQDGEGRPILRRGADPAKDQSYFLAGLAPDQLAAVRFPLGNACKHEVREEARRLDLPTATAADSQDACLVAPGQSFAEMLRQRFSAAAVPGSVVDRDGTCLGLHLGIHHFTVGQSRGLPGPSHIKRWVTAIRGDNGTVTVSSRAADLEGLQFAVGGLNWLLPEGCPSATRCLVQVRYRQSPVPATLEPTGGTTARIALDSPLRAIAPGQAAVFYDGDRVLGRGWIETNQETP